MIIMDFIDQFIARYLKEYDFYGQAARLGHQKLEEDLQAAGIRSIVTARAKSITRLEDKCRQRALKRGEYASIDAIYDDIVDLAGIRIALYFPAEVDQVDGMIARLFHVIAKKEFPDSEGIQTGKRFTGYSATHYRVQLREEDLNEVEKRYAAARIEIQVASVLMHAWAEVEHDLVYKPLAGSLSEEEYAILDQLNGLVIAGEIALERLQKAGEARVANSDRRIANHYDLAVHLLSAVETITDQPISESGLGRVDLLFDFINALGINTPELLRPYIEALHGNVELRPLAEQIVDALLAEDPRRYEIYNSIRAQRRLARVESESDHEMYRHIGMFMSRWMELESLLRELSPPKPGATSVVPTARQLMNLHLINDDKALEFDRLRRMRNLLVHGVELSPLADLEEGTRRLDEILHEIRQVKMDRDK
jgi:ppGpp synthetase/RelA/SpoT-type nucleotidyltranferase